MSAIAIAAGQIAMGMGDAFICGGVELMTRVPKGGFNFSPNPRQRPGRGVHRRGQTAENVARQYGVACVEQERLACSSQMKAAAARAAGRPGRMRSCRCARSKA